MTTIVLPAMVDLQKRRGNGAICPFERIYEKISPFYGMNVCSITNVLPSLGWSLDRLLSSRKNNYQRDQYFIFLQQKVIHTLFRPYLRGGGLLGQNTILILVKTIPNFCIFYQFEPIGTVLERL